MGTGLLSTQIAQLSLYFVSMKVVMQPAPLEHLVLPRGVAWESGVLPIQTNTLKWAAAVQSHSSVVQFRWVVTEQCLVSVLLGSTFVVVEASSTAQCQPA